MGNGFLETTVDKFTFRVKAGCRYSAEGLWIQPEGDHVRLGLTDYLQQTSGDMAFLEVAPPGTELSAGDKLASVETVKTVVEVGSPLSGTVVEVNDRLEASPELVNEDPYGEGWLVLLAPAAWDREEASLMTDQAYLEVVHGLASEEMKK